MRPSLRIIQQYTESDKFLGGNMDLLLADFNTTVVRGLILDNMTQEQMQIMIDLNFVSFLIGVVVVTSKNSYLNRHRSMKNISK